MALKDVDLDSALRRMADRHIEEAIKEGKFSNLRGAGLPLNLEPMPADENARMTWWMLRILKNNDFTPDEVQWRKQIDGLMDELRAATTEARVKALVKAVNALVHRLNTLGTNAINLPVMRVSEEGELRRLRERLATPRPQAAAPAIGEIRQCANRACKSRNPAPARYCRRCGTELATDEHR
jgi:hypothetical protein